MARVWSLWCPSVASVYAESFRGLCGGCAGRLGAVSGPCGVEAGSECGLCGICVKPVWGEVRWVGLCCSVSFLICASGLYGILWGSLRFDGAREDSIGLDGAQWGSVGFDGARGG